MLLYLDEYNFHTGYFIRVVTSQREDLAGLRHIVRCQSTLTGRGGVSNQRDDVEVDKYVAVRGARVASLDSLVVSFIMLTNELS